MKDFEWIKGFDLDFIDNGEIKIKDIHNIYDSLVDEKSKELFVNRLMYILTGEDKYKENIIKFPVSDEVFVNKLKSAPRVGVFGAGVRGMTIVNIFPEIDFCAYIDNNKDLDKPINNLPVYRLETFAEKYNDAIILISTSYENGNMEIYNQLLQYGIEKERIVNLAEVLEKQYFDYFKPGVDNEVFVDAGVFDGGSSILFSKWCNGKYDKIFAFEPDAYNISRIKNNVNLPNFNLFNKGVYSKAQKMFFDIEGNSGTKISENGENSIEVVDLDSILGKEKVTFIKMDVEGAELEALKGAKGILKSQKPKLAICIYHKPEDIIEIPKIILELNPDYKLAMRHYGIDLLETVLYAY